MMTANIVEVNIIFYIHLIGWFVCEGNVMEYNKVLLCCKVYDDDVTVKYEKINILVRS